jgi:hypothetical protein
MVWPFAQNLFFTIRGTTWHVLSLKNQHALHVVSCRHHESMPPSVMWPCDSDVSPQHDLLAACCGRINESMTQPVTAETAVIDNVLSQP